MWNLKFNAPVGARKSKNVFRHIQVSAEDHELPSMWVNQDERVFLELIEFGNIHCSDTLRGVNSVKAFKRYLKKHCNHLKEYKITLCSKYQIRNRNNQKLYDYDVVATWIE